MSIDKALNTDNLDYLFPSRRQKPLGPGTANTDGVPKFAWFQGSTKNQIKCVFFSDDIVNAPTILTWEFGVGSGGKLTPSRGGKD